MNERKLSIFYNVGTQLNMTEVARSMYISQPAISQTIHELEDELGVKLFDRINKKLYLTHEGELFLNYTRRILNLYEDAAKAMKDVLELNSGKLIIGASTTIGIYILPELIGEFKKKYKDVDVSIIIENTDNIIELLLKNKIDFAFVEGYVHSEEILEQDFAKDELVIIFPPNHEFAKKESVNKDKLKNEKIIMREIGSGTREVTEAIFKTNKIEYNLQFDLGNTEAIKRAVASGLGISCMSKRCLKDEVKAGKLAYAKIKGIDATREFKLIYHKDKCLNKIMETFIEYAYKNINNG